MSDQPTNRRLAAILAADVVGYSRLMGIDEAGTLAALKRHRETVFNPTVASFGGRIVKLIGDGTLVEFMSVVDAVGCAVEIQRLIGAEESDDALQIVLRIGINLGDVIVDGDDIYGDGVNVASRLEPLAPHGGICISAIVFESVRGRIEVAFADAGEVQIKNIDRPVRVWKWHPDQQPEPETAAAGDRSTPAPAPRREERSPSIAVLPFDNMSGDPEQEYFSDGISEDIITDLSKVSGLTVIARNSSFAYKGRAVDLRQVGGELGVDKILEGSIRKAGNRVRVTAQLIEAESGAHLWAERFDRDLTDIFEVQDDVTRHIVGALKLKLSPSDMAKIGSGGTSNAEAHDALLRARKVMEDPSVNKENFDEARRLIKRALELDPEYALATATLALNEIYDYHNRFTDDPDNALQRADALATRATELDPNELVAQHAVSVVAGFLKQPGRSAAATEKALDINPNYSPALASRGVFAIYDSRPADALADLEKAMRLDPAYSQQYLHFLGFANMYLGRYETAAAMFRERIMQAPDTDASRVMLAATLGHLGRLEKARTVWATLMERHPDYRLDEHLGRLPFEDPADLNRITEGLAKAGLPPD